ncbi:MAG: PIN domain-containing protein [Acidobacteriota bacterium]|nr:MAG: PIN domain-containing protein [Acidobacteriota bacterium]
MIFPDVNMLLYAYDRNSPLHTEAKLWLEETLSEKEVFFSWQTITGFVRILTHPSILRNPAPLSEAVQVVSDWLDRENTHLVSFGTRNWPLFARMLTETQATGNLVMDAHIASMAVSCGATVATTDLDFSRFQNLRTINPLQT